MTPEQIQKAEEDMRVMLTYSAGHVLSGFLVFLPFSIAYASFIGSSYSFNLMFYGLFGSSMAIIGLILNPLTEKGISSRLVSASFIRYVQVFVGYFAFGILMYLTANAWLSLR